MHFHINVGAVDPEEESKIIKKIVSHLLRNGINNVVMLVDGEQTNYENGEVTVVEPSMGSLFNIQRSTLPVAVVLAANRKN